MKNYLILATLLLAASMQSCYPEGPEYVSDMDIAMTTYDTSADFSKYSTYSLPDTVIYFDNNSKAVLGAKFDSLILNLVEEQFNALGYTKVTPSDVTQPAAIVTISAYSQDNYGYYTNNWYDYWGWYWGSLWPGYTFSPFYGWDPYGYDYYVYEDGAIIIDMIDNTKFYKGEGSNSRTLNILWKGIVNGIISGNSNQLMNRISNEVEQCFNQSPYLDINK
ncbi:MAG: DUF4136 domain-containing protein [Marinifilaceae bacterium]|nr:DUF4136 domain-containing protein [Marinifilaceae bacterium]